MADGILGLGSSGSADLNQELIDKLKGAETKAFIDPIEANQEKAQKAIDAVDEIASKFDEFLAIVKEFDLFNTGTNAFEQVSASTTGTAASFDAADTSNIKPGTIDVIIGKLAQKDVYQTNTISDKSAIMPSGSVSIAVGAGETIEYDTTGKTYEEFVTELNYNSKLDVSLEQVGGDSYRMVIKSAESGLANELTISQTGIDLGFQKTVAAQNMEATIDGIAYNLSSNKITLDNGLMITAVEKGNASISIARDDNYLMDQINALATSYNELVDLVDSYTIGDADNPAIVSDSSTLRSIMGDIKGMFYDKYGLEDEENVFVYGISFNIDGHMEVDPAALSDAITNNYEDIKELFMGYAEKEGIGTRLKTYVDDLDGFEGTMTTYEERLQDRLKDLNEDHESETERIDSKYAQLAQQFADYTVIINQMESSFSSLKLIMNLESRDN